jgi:hypothetical protein
MELVTFNDTMVYATDDILVPLLARIYSSMTCKSAIATLPSVAWERPIVTLPFVPCKRAVIFPSYCPEVVTLFSATYAFLIHHSDLALTSTMTHLFSAFFYIISHFHNSVHFYPENGGRMCLYNFGT